MAKTKDDNDELEHAPKKARVLKDGERLRTPMYAERLRTPMYAMDSVQKSIATHQHPSLSKPGYRFITDSEARARIEDAHQAYREELSNRWRSSDGKEGDSCTAPDGTPGVLQFVAGRLVCQQRAAAKTADTKLIDADFDINDDADLRELAYRLYDADVSSRWKGK